MNTSEKQRFSKLIHDMLARLDEEKARGQEGQSVVTLDQQSVGRLSRQDALLSQSMAKATQARRDVQAMRLTQALARLETDEYGYCEDCGEEIALKRLEFDPAVTRCISCANG
ncbi:TraR/DksA C4-type zinc finger protein [Primorskyibacter aestuariivivens]|uniref:TraR/DksA family transcriptional regulator n=1 Tax=Primorskyibacter aestuariivivens TaxID=1888912 RepID=UPI002301AAC4|nr:TraR/DksA C4-type zinc finger protein [Primorskyibacter aestuariivivens]MDA7429839.1 TraR/DksA C4-type zinc finger protein [Primorskyibacter aestuariivivens]